jgi:hypothetical protein
VEVDFLSLHLKCGRRRGKGLFFLLNFFFIVEWLRKGKVLCRNPSNWLATKARGLQGCGPKSRPGSHFTYSRECKECEGMSPHTPK